MSNSYAEKSTFKKETSLAQTLILAFQHVLTMCPGSLAVPLILGNALGLDTKDIAFLVSANLFTSGIAVLIQIFGFGGIGSKLPIIIGSSFAPLGVMIMIGERYSLATIFGSIIGAGVLIFLLSFFLHKILKLFPPVVVGSFVTLIGVSLAPTAIKDLAGGPFSPNYGSISNLLLGLFVLLVIILIDRFGSGLARSLSLLIGLVSGTLIGGLLNMVDLTPISSASWFEIITPFKFGLPEFKLGPIVLMTLFCIINMIQFIGGYAVLGEVTNRKIDEKTKINGIKGQALGQLIAGMFNSIPGTVFNENIGLMGLTKVDSKSVIGTAGAFLVILGIFPKFAAAVTIIPAPVLGGATLYLFGVITAAGVSILSSLDFGKDNVFSIIGTSLAVGVGATFAPEIFTNLPATLSMLLGNGLFTVSFTAILLNLIYNGLPKEG